MPDEMRMQRTADDDRVVKGEGIFLPTLVFRWTRPKVATGWIAESGIQLQQLFREHFGQGREEWRPVPFIPEE